MGERSPGEMSSTSFELEITDQHWFAEPDQQVRDGCSHGRIRAVIGGVRVTSDEAEYGISQSALALLRTLERDHTPQDPVSDDFLLCHGCGYPTHFGCANFGTDWVVRHDGDTVFLSQPSHYSALTGEAEFDVQARVPIEHYRREIVAFAQTAHQFYFSAEPRQLEDWEQDLHDAFWTEFNERLARARKSISGWPLSDGRQGAREQ